MNSTRGPKHGQSERQIIFFRAKQMQKKARQAEHGSHPTILSRWYEQEGYRRLLTEHNIGEKEPTVYDGIALERPDCTPTRAERQQKAKHWDLRLNADGPQKPSSTATRICRRIKTIPENSRCSPGGNTTNSDTDTSTTSTAATTKSTI